MLRAHAKTKDTHHTLYTSRYSIYPALDFSFVLLLLLHPLICLGSLASETVF